MIENENKEKREKVLRLPRGIYDVPPEKFRSYLWLLDNFRATCASYGYKLMEPATIELFQTLALKSGPDIAKEIYEFKDKGGRHLGLRFDLTVGLSRYVAMNPSLPKPIRLASYSVQWRYDEPQFGRYRSFYAWDIEIYGGEEVYSATETILFINNFLQRIGLKHFNVLISDRRFIENIIRDYCPDSDAISIMRVLDKWGKMKKEEIVSSIEKLGGKDVDDMINLLFYSKESEISSILNRYKAKELVMLFNHLKNDLSIDNVKIDPSIVRGLDYYDGIVFEVKDEISPEIGSLVGGGNYSKLLKIFGSNLNALGAAGGIERTLLALEREGISFSYDKFINIFLVPLSPKFIPYAFKLAEKIRGIKNVSVETPVVFRSLRRYLHYINKMNFDYAIFIGEKEVKEEKINLKDLRTRKEYFVSLEEAIKIICSEI